ncbi:DUF222 domain-containing protein [Rhodococcus spelaei]|uniref:DUF222 domain-containing protein n=1 Tax=Rhodococcus spelaei TaxID=2546320 RepID=UPI0020981180|nr:DUF222 domain-containing protein [Rhodococcus spelaei]
MHSIAGVGEVGQVATHLTALSAAVDGLLTDELSGLTDAEVVETLQRLEASLRKAAAVGTRLVVEAVERSLPGSLDCSSISTFLIATLRISSGDAARRVAAAKKVGTWHNPTGEQLPPDLPATATAQRDGAIGPDHVHEIRGVLGKTPRAVDPAAVEVAEQIRPQALRAGRDPQPSWPGPRPRGRSPTRASSCSGTSIRTAASPMTRTAPANAASAWANRMPTS